MPVIRTVNAVPDDVLITGIHCIIVKADKIENLHADTQFGAVEF